ncbi:flagellar basal body-associated FliL family protein [Desulfocurvus vexinensis]|uniref:flagellar basal body-associated FliL family protein n=1 Tax=Desulfocurvus vexinensis TaxID=399548 RepID=UPI00048E96BC|nr:flagellar basal body-associated FliL family protein [Desulfocurvus vexinensis]
MVPDANIADGLADNVKAELDAEELTANLPKEQQKVELDLEDAPFLEEEEEEEEEQPQEQPAAPVALESAADGPKPWFRRKEIIIPAGAGALALLVLLLWLVLRAAPEPEAPAPAPEELATQPGDEPLPPPAEEAQPQEYMVTLAPFWVEQRDDKGAVRFLVCQFTAVTNDEKLSFEITQKTTILRDAVFYYLKNKDLTYLSDKTNVEALKTDLLSVMNQYLSVGRLETILVDQYLVK